MAVRMIPLQKLMKLDHCSRSKLGNGIGARYVEHVIIGTSTYSGVLVYTYSL
jgi:hypothetical protein